MIQAIICDLDETLLNKDKTVSDNNLKTINTLKEHGIYFIPATGRPFYSIASTLETLDLFRENDVSISYNGGMVHKNKTKEVLSVDPLDRDLVEWLYEFGTQKDVCIHTYIEGHTYTYNLNEDEKEHCKNFPGFEESFEVNLDFLNDTPILKILYQNTDLDYLREVESHIPNHLKDRLEISYSSNRYLEFNPKGISKGEAVKLVAQTLNLDIEKILTIGDNLNDLSMITVSGHSAAPNNAVDAVKAAAHYVSPHAFHEDAVTDIVNHFIKL